ncbi:alpha/beta hydrolase fold domain-containing protein [Cryptosporangium arvum]|uniref:alpha/beta hydrolase fold domain-containing protein n=1 Tax=Cryptosporangium arvum TaxID=80871 RepID=UPI000683E01C|nr:alpha/beta hydrolase fold domain-containing protein [Cryptosporangium arvum]
MALPYPTLPGDVDRAVADDFAVVLRLLDHLENVAGDRRTLADQLVHRYTSLSAGLEQVVFPAFKEHAAVDDAMSAQHSAKERLAVIEAAEPGEAEFEQALLRLIEGTRLHAAEVEGDLLPALRASGANLRALGDDYLAARRHAPSHAHPDAPTSPGASKIVAAVTSVIDGLLDRSSGRVERLATDASGLLDHDAQRVVDAFANLQPRPLDTLTPEEAREQPTFRNAVSVAAPDPAERRTIAGVPTLLFRPAGVETVLPVVVFAHGGGGVVGAAANTSAQALCDQLDCLVVSVDYRLAPEHPFPAGHDDVRAVLEWVLVNAGELGGDPARVIAAGESMGANLVASAAAASEPKPVAQLLLTPLTTATQDTPSMYDSADAALLDRPTLDWFLTHFFADPADALDPRFALLEAPAEMLAAMPPTHVVTAERDPLRDQGELFAARLAEAGVPTTLSRYTGVPHAFFGLGADVQASVQAQLDAAGVLRPYLGS